MKFTISLLENSAASPHPSRFTNPPDDISSSCSRFCDGDFSTDYFTQLILSTLVCAAMCSAGNPLVLATPIERDPVERQEHAIERLTSYWQLIFRGNDSSKSAEDILDLVESLQDDLEAIGAPDLPSRARKKQAELLHHADELKAIDVHENWDATSTTDVSAGATTNWTAQEIEDEVDRRLSTDQDWRYRPLARDPRSTPKRFMRSLWRHCHEAWELGSMSKEAEDHYLSLWRADEPFRHGVDPQQSHFAEILRDPNSEGTEDNAVWRKVRDIKGGAQGKISLWRMTRQNGRVRSSNTLRK